MPLSIQNKRRCWNLHRNNDSWWNVRPRSAQCSQNVDVNGPHHGPYQLMASSSLYCHRLVEWGRQNELEASMVGAVYVHVLRTLGRPAISQIFSNLPTSIRAVTLPKIDFHTIFDNVTLLKRVNPVNLTKSSKSNCSIVFSIAWPLINILEFPVD